MSRASNLAGFVSAIYPDDNLSVGFLTVRNLNVTGVSTFGTIDISGVTYAASAGVATYAQTAGVATVGGIGIQSGGSQIGTGVTIINFVGAGNSIRAVGDTVEISIAGSGGGGGGGGGSIGIQSGGTRVALGVTDINIAIGSTTSRRITGSGTTQTIDVDLGEYYIFRKAAVGFATMRVLIAGANGGIAKSDYLGGSSHAGLSTTNTDQFPWVSGIGMSISSLGHLIFTVP